LTYQKLKISFKIIKKNELTKEQIQNLKEIDKNIFK
jgi:hypothetical protein